MLFFFFFLEIIKLKIKTSSPLWRSELTCESCLCRPGAVAQGATGGGRGQDQQSRELMRLLGLYTRVGGGVGGGAQVSSVEDVCNQSGGGERVRAQQHGQCVVMVTFHFKHHLKTRRRRRRTDQHT